MAAEADTHAVSLSSVGSSKRKLQCENCRATETGTWRRDPGRRTLCNACGLYLRTHKRSRPAALFTRCRRRRPSALTLSSPGDMADHGGAGSISSQPLSSPDGSPVTITTPGPAHQAVYATVTSPVSVSATVTTPQLPHSPTLSNIDAASLLWQAPTTGPSEYATPTLGTTSWGTVAPLLRTQGLRRCAAAVTTPSCTQASPSLSCLSYTGHRALLLAPTRSKPACLLLLRTQPLPAALRGPVCPPTTTR